MAGTDRQHAAAAPAERAGSVTPTVLPWRIVLTLGGAVLALEILGALLTGGVGSPAALAGFGVGCFAALSGGRRLTLQAGLAFMAAIALVFVFPALPVLLGVCLALSAAAAVEVERFGSRASAMVLMGVILTALTFERGGDLWALALALAGLGTGHLVMGHLQLSGLLRHPPASRAESVGLGLFLAAGVLLSLALAATINAPHGYWIVLLFVGRTLMPMQHRPEALLKYGHGAALGVIAALAVELAGTADVLRLLLAMAAFLVGLRFLTHPLPISVAGMTAGVLLASAPSPEAASFRAVAILLVVALVLFLTLVLERVVPRLLAPRRVGQSAGRSPADP